MYESLFENFITILRITYENKIINPGKSREVSGLFRRIASYINYMEAISV